MAKQTATRPGVAKASRPFKTASRATSPATAPTSRRAVAGRTRRATAADRPTAAAALVPVAAETAEGRTARETEGQRAVAAAKLRKGAGKPEPARVRSGGPLHPDPTKAPVDSQGETPKVAPDLADNPPDVARATRRADSAFPPIDITKVDDIEELSEKIRLCEKADVLYHWKAQEKASDAPRANVIDAINNRLLDVQGPPLPVE